MRLLLSGLCGNFATGLLAIGNIGRKADQAKRAACLVSKNKSLIKNPADGAIGAANSVGRLHSVTRIVWIQKNKRAFLILWQNRVDPGVRIFVNTLARTSPYGFVSRAQVQDVLRLRIQEPKNFVMGFHRRNALGTSAILSVGHPLERGDLRIENAYLTVFDLLGQTD